MVNGPIALYPAILILISLNKQTNNLPQFFFFPPSSSHLYCSPVFFPLTFVITHVSHCFSITVPKNLFMPLVLAH